MKQEPGSENKKNDGTAQTNSKMIFKELSEGQTNSYNLGVNFQILLCAWPYQSKWMHVCSQSLSTVWLFVTPWTAAHQAPLSMEFSRQEYWSGLPFPSLEDLPNPRIKPESLMFPALAGRFFTTSATWETPKIQILCYKNELIELSNSRKVRET